MDYKKI